MENLNRRVFFTQVHGILHANADGTRRQQIIRHCEPGEELVLLPEPTNPYDASAVKICRKNGQQLGYWQADGRMAHDLAIGWSYRVTIDEIYPFRDEPKKQGVKLRVEVLTMSRRTEEREKREAVETVQTELKIERDATPSREKWGWFRRLLRWNW